MRAAVGRVFLHALDLRAQPVRGSELGLRLGFPPLPPLLLPAVAEAIAQSMLLDVVEGKKYAIASKKGDGPGEDPAKWKALYASLEA